MEAQKSLGPVGIHATCPQAIASVALMHAAMDDVADYAATLPRPLMTDAQVEALTDAADANPLPGYGPTPVQALVALLAECEPSLDFRPSFRRAIADGYTAVLSPRPVRILADGQTVTLGAGPSIETSEDDALTLALRDAGACA